MPTMKRLLTFIRTLLPKCGAPFFQSQADKRMWGDLHCTRPRWHKGPHFWLNTERPSYPPDPEWRPRKRPRYGVSQANNPRAQCPIIPTGTKLLEVFGMRRDPGPRSISSAAMAGFDS